MTRYTLRCRCTDARGGVLLIVDDDQHTAYVFGGGKLQIRQPGQGRAENLARLLANHAACSPLRDRASYTLEGLCRLTREAAGNAAGAPLPGVDRTLVGGLAGAGGDRH